MELREELRKGLEKLTDELNHRRQLGDKIRGVRYELREHKDSYEKEFVICVDNRGGRKLHQGTPILAEVKIRDGGLTGMIIPLNERDYSFVRDYLHWFSHANNVSMGHLAHSY